jgi:hypothetical protein
MGGSERMGSPAPRLIEGRWYTARGYRWVYTGLGGLFIVWGWIMLFLGLNPETSHGSEAWYVWSWFVGWNVIGSAMVLSGRRNAVRIRTEGVDARGLVRARTYRWDEIAGFEGGNTDAKIVVVLASGERRRVVSILGGGRDGDEILDALRGELAHRRWRT